MGRPVSDRDPKAIRQELISEGYLVLRSTVEREAVAALRSEVLAVLQRHGWLLGSEDLPSAVPDKLRQEASFGWWECYEDLQRLEAFHQLAHHPGILAGVAGLIGDDLLSHGRRVLSMVYPKCWIPAHQDFVYIQGAVDTVCAWIPLDAPLADQPQLRVIRGAPEKRLLPMRRTRTGGVSVDIPDDDPRWVTVELNPGDVCLYHSLTIHQVTPNRARDIAFFCEYRYQTCHDQACLASLKPHHFRRLPDWDEIAAGWASRQWLPDEHKALLVPYHMPSSLETWHRELRLPESVLLR